MKRFTNLLLIVAMLLPVMALASCNNGRHMRDDDDEIKSKPWLGVVVKDLKERQKEKLRLDHGVEVARVVHGSPAEKAGLEEDDILLEFDGNEVKDADALMEMVREADPDAEVRLDVLRYGDNIKLTATLKKRKHYAVRVAPRSGNALIWNEKRAYLGVRTEGMSEQLRRYFGVDEDYGVLVSEVIEDSPAEEAGVKAGDVIIEIDGKRVRKSSDLIKRLRKREADEKIDLVIVRDHSEKTIPVTLGENESRRSWSYHFDADDGDVRVIVPDVEIPDIDIEIPDFEIEAPEIIYYDDGREIKMELKEKQHELREQLKEMRETLRDNRHIRLKEI